MPGPALAVPLLPAVAGRLASPVVVRAAALTVGLLPLAAFLAVMAERADPPLLLALAGGIALMSVLALALARYDAAVGLGFLLMAVVKIEPAPVDALFAIVIAVALVTGRFRLGRTPMVMSGAIGLLIVLNLLSLLEAVDLQTATRFLLITLYLFALALWLTGWLDRPSRARLLVRCWLVVAVPSALAGAAALYLPIPGNELLTAYERTRAAALFEDPNVFGPFLIPILVIVLEDRLNPRLLKPRPTLLALAVVVIAVGVVLSYSRAAWANLVLAVVVMLGVLAFRRRGGRAAFRLLTTLVVVGLTAAVFLQSTGGAELFEQRAQLQGYDSQRFGAQRIGVELSMAHPVGVGPGQFQYYSPVETHSTYVRVLSEQGLLALLLTTVIFGGTLLMALGNALSRGDTYGIGSAALLGIWCGILLNSFVIDTLHWRHLWVVAPLIWVGWVTRQTSRRVRI